MFFKRLYPLADAINNDQVSAFLGQVEPVPSPFQPPAILVGRTEE